MTNIGLTKGFRLYKEIVRSFCAIGATCIDFCNFRQDMLAYIAGADAQMVVEDMFKKNEMNPDFYFDFDLDDGGQLCKLFWADGTSRRNFACFGDVMSFDATYRTNKYKLVFVPFTGVDHHKRCITFGAELLAKEDIESYEWLLNSLKNVVGATPRYAITDQDPALRVALPNIMPTTRHIFFWDETLSIEEFEIRWLKVMEDYNLVEDRWFAQLYEARASWIPAYFHDIFMGGLFKTTSQLEAENSYFGNFTNHHYNLVEFFMQYNSVINEQRYKQTKLNAECEGSFPETKTPLYMERHAATLYTINMFYEFQIEI
ncbi:protein FAR1-RELATED SEQUENCE 5-like [Ipomoea triloba]|uniref:protein FAR1-RELATED SEQUENCE 5-like n=1 Tax=Ipomoea triloba TaxID=35885 RepID=UPI00125D2960|nr:protein FAR1-RELATED SEQUENCE 5-like [Ipomoea triloba]